MTESIYNLIPPEEVGYDAPPLYRSKYNKSKKGLSGPMITESGAVLIGTGVNNDDSIPSYSTFPNKKCGGHLVSVVGTDGTAAKLFARPAAPIGKEVADTIDTKNFLKKGEKHPPLPQPRNVQRALVVAPRAPVTKNDDAPVMGLSSNRNFVRTNAVEAICTEPKKRNAEGHLAVHRKDFGRVPVYLDRVKDTLREERELLEAYDERIRAAEAKSKAQYIRELCDEERTELLVQLKNAFGERMRVMQSLPFSRDTMSQKIRREALEVEIKEIEKGIEKLEKKVVYVYRDDPRCKDWCKAAALKESQMTALQRTGQLQVLMAKK
eukprot:Tbor_TRINITY_DN2448_c0_g1::TRINITY_DN2448_c0_g1_i1::g.2557::m.2557